MSKLSFFCVQPISINKENYIKLINNKDTNINEYSNFVNNETEMSWLKDNRYYNSEVYNKILNIDLKLKIDLDDLILDINKMKEKYDFIKDLNNETDYNLLYDTKLKYFILITNVIIDIDETKIITDEHNDFYNDIRNLLVKELDESVESFWSTAVKKTILDYCLYIVKNIEYINFKENPFYITHNTGNITCFSDVKNNKFNEKLFEINENSERKKRNGKYIKILNEKYLFRGRFHTIIINDEKSILRYFPIQFYMQYAWFYLQFITDINNKVIEEIGLNNHSMIYEEKINFLTVLLSKLIYTIYFNESFKNSIENDSDEIYSKIENSWNIEGRIKKLEHYVFFYKEHLEHIKNEKKSKLLIEIEELKQEKRLLKDRREKDGLTRAYTRAVFDKDIDLLVKQNNNLSLAFIDGDNFKKINDTYGHQIGDEVLKEIVSVIHQVLRKNDIFGKIYRYGGEEFVLVVQNENNLQVLGLLEMIRKEIDEKDFNFDGVIVKFTVSIGVSFYHNEDTVKSLLKRADENVYKAKHSGKNRVVN